MEKTQKLRHGFFQRVTCLCIAFVLIYGSGICGIFGETARAETNNMEPAEYSCENSATNSATLTYKGVSSKPDPQRHAEALVQKALSYEGKTKKEMGFTIEWCALFVGRCAKESGIPNDVIPNKISMVATFFDTMVKSGYKAYKLSDLKSGNYKPEVGDLLFNDTTKKLGHIAIISKVYENGSFETIDGNVTSEDDESRVERLLYRGDGEPLNTVATINSFIRPDYASMDKNAVATSKPEISVVETNGSAGGFNTAALCVESNGYAITCDNYLGETSPFDMKLFGWGSVKNTLSVFILDDDSTKALDADIFVNEKVNGKQINIVQLSSRDKYTGEVYYDFFKSTDSSVYPLKKGASAPTIRFRYYYQENYNEYYSDYIYIRDETYVAYDSVGLYCLVLTPSEANNYLATEKYTYKYYEPNGTGYKPASKTVQIPGLKKLLNTQKIR